MRWTTEDVDSYLREKEYVDTVVIPLIPITWHNEIKLNVEAGEFAALLTDELEEQLKGRIFHFPPFTYLKSEAVENRVARLKEWKQELLSGDMKHVFFITSDTDWKSLEGELNDSLIWIPSVPMQHMSEENKEEIINGQIKQLLQIVTVKWQNGYNYE
ncbi:MAG TPA: YpiF family protein [Bacillales bacterium]